MLAGVSACGSQDSPPTPVAVELACGAGDGARVQVEGFLRLPDRLAMTDRATINLFTRREGEGDRVAIEFVLGTGPNQLEPLEEGFTPTSLRVRGNGGTLATIADVVTVNATVSGKDPNCVLRDPVVSVRPR